MTTTQIIPIATQTEFYLTTCEKFKYKSYCLSLINGKGVVFVLPYLDSNYELKGYLFYHGRTSHSSYLRKYSELANTKIRYTAINEEDLKQLPYNLCREETAVKAAIDILWTNWRINLDVEHLHI